MDHRELRTRIRLPMKAKTQALFDLGSALVRCRSGALVILGVLTVTAVSCVRSPTPIAFPQVTIEDPSFAPTMEAYTSAPVRWANRVEILLNGEQIFPAQVSAIRSAQKTFTYAQYVYETGPPAQALLKAMTERCQAGIHGHVLVDAIGSQAMPAESREALERAGCEFALFKPVDLPTIGEVNNRNHRRILVVDGRIGFTGGSGASSKWMGNGRREGYWRQTDVRIEGHAVTDLQAAFAENWLEATGRALGGAAYFPRQERRGEVQAQIVRSSPERGSLPMYLMYLFAISSAQRAIHLTNPYFVPDGGITNALVDARARGVRVVLLLPGDIDHEIVEAASRAGFGRLLDAGVEIYEYQTGLLHAKTMTIDGEWAMVGSANMDNRSLALNNEICLVAYDHEVAGRLQSIFEEDLSHSRAIDVQAWHTRSLWKRLWEFLSLPIRSLL
jgi:cardiolipin synthase A/B